MHYVACQHFPGSHAQVSVPHGWQGKFHTGEHETYIWLIANENHSVLNGSQLTRSVTRLPVRNVLKTNVKRSRSIKVNYFLRESLWGSLYMWTSLWETHVLGVCVAFACFQRMLRNLVNSDCVMFYCTSLLWVTRFYRIIYSMPQSCDWFLDRYFSTVLLLSFTYHIMRLFVMSQRALADAYLAHPTLRAKLISGCSWLKTKSPWSRSHRNSRLPSSGVSVECIKITSWNWGCCGQTFWLLGHDGAERPTTKCVPGR